MTALTQARSITSTSSGRFAGLAPLVRKDITEWFRGTRAWVVAIVVSLFMVFTAANAAITAWLIANLPDDVAAPTAPPTLAPLDNLGAAIGSQIFVLAVVFAVASLLVRERESGTLAWVASKPVSRGSIWLAKWASASLMLAVFAVIVPLAITLGTVVVLYGVPDLAVVAAIVAGAIALVVFYAALGLAAATVLPGIVPVVAIGFAVFGLSPIVGAIIPAIAPLMPTAIFEWAAGAAMGAPVSPLTPVAWAIGTAGLAAAATRRMRGLEL